MAVRKKRSISMPPDLDAEIAAAAAEAGLSYSAWLAETARKEFTIRAGLAAVGEFEREHGAFTAAELAEAESWADRAIESLDDVRARATGALAAQAKTADVVDACVVEGALRRHDLVVSSDSADLQLIASAVGSRLEIDHP